MTGFKGEGASKQIEKALRMHLPPAQGMGVLAISGGMDSMTMLRAAHALRHAIAPFCVATVDHGLRAASAADAEFVRAFCQVRGIDCFVERVDVRRRSGSSELAARLARYEALARVAHGAGATWIATAHHADDQAETVLLHVLRGASLHGLGAMRLRAPHPTQPGLTLLRPLLDIPHDTLMAYAEQHSIPFREDSTNSDQTLRRNHLRQAVMPLLQMHNPRVRQALGRLAQHAQDNAELAERVFTSDAAPHISQSSTHWQMPLTVLRALPAALQKMFVVRAWSALTHNDDSLSLEQVERALTVLLQGDVRHMADLPRRVPASLRYEADALHAVIGVARWQMRLHQAQRRGVPITMNKALALDGGSILVTRGAEGQPFYVASDGVVSVRGRRAGDRICPPKLGGHSTSLAEWMVDQRIPREERNYLPLLCVDDVIAVIVRESQSIVTFAFAHPSQNSELVRIQVMMGQ